MSAFPAEATFPRRPLTASELRWIAEGISVDWEHLVVNYILTEEFMDHWADTLDWQLISQYQQLSEEFITKHSGQVAWYYITWHQELSAEFIITHLARLDPEGLIRVHPEIYRVYHLEVYYGLTR